MYLHGHPFLFEQTPKNYLIMLGPFSIRISDFSGSWLPKCFVVDFSNFGEISGFAKYVPLLCPYFILRLPCCALIFLRKADMHQKKILGHSRVSKKQDNGTAE